MAIQTKNLLLVNGAGGQFRIDFSYDDVDLLLTAISSTNDDTDPHDIEAMSTVNGNTYTTTIEPNSSIDQVIPQDVIDGFQLSITTGGKLDGIEWHSD